MTKIRQRDIESSVNGLRSVHFSVVDFEKTLEFFVNDWGLSVVSNIGGKAYLRAAGGSAYVVALHQSDRTEVLRVDLTAPDRDAIALLHQRLTAQNAAGLTDPAPLAEHGGGYGFRVRDHEGRLYMILAEDEALEPVETIDRPRKLAHIVLNTKDVEGLTGFLENGLGFRLIDRTRRIHFFNCNSDHHSLALIPGAQNTLNHVAFEMAGFDALMRGVGRLRAGGHGIAWGIGRHGPGNNIFVYFVGPEILPLEYTAEVMQVDESYSPGTPEDWKPTPGKMDQWGATGAPSTEMKEAELAIFFSASTL
jgi:catechol-2,3-dioxygenase